MPDVAHGGSMLRVWRSAMLGGTHTRAWDSRRKLRENALESSWVCATLSAASLCPTFRFSKTALYLTANKRLPFKSQKHLRKTRWRIRTKRRDVIWKTPGVTKYIINWHWSTYVFFWKKWSTCFICKYFQPSTLIFSLQDHIMRSSTTLRRIRG